MRLLILSDLHLEFAGFTPDADAIERADVIVLAGDICPGDEGVQWARHVFAGKPVLYVPGNHEYYDRQLASTLDGMRAAAIHGNVTLLDMDEVVIAGVRFLGTTLWTDFRLLDDSPVEIAYAMHDAQSYIADFRLIWNGQERFTPSASVELHQESLAWLEAKLAEPFDGKTVVVTHHLPSMKSVADRFKNKSTSAAFASRLDRLFGKMDLWVHGHTHDSFDYVAKGTRVVCNPRGYTRKGTIENHEFRPDLVVEI